MVGRDPSTAVSLSVIRHWPGALGAAWAGSPSTGRLYGPEARPGPSQQRMMVAVAIERRADRPQPLELRDQASESLRTVLVAGSANLAIAVAKGVAALMTGSAAMLAETVHSVADTGNEVLLFIGVRRSARGPDEKQPFGYGQERYFWAFLAALGIFVVGGLLSIVEGLRSVLRPEPLESPWVAIAVLVTAMFFEGLSFRTARRQLRASARARRRSFVDQLRLSSDPSPSTVYLEDSAALIGLFLALVALVLHVLTGWAIWDTIASVAIGLLLLAVAWVLAQRSKALLLNESAPPDVLDRLHATVSSPDWVAEVRALNAVFVGPSQLLVLVTIAPVPALTRGAASELIDQATALRQKLLAYPTITHAAVTLVGHDRHDGERASA